MSVKNKITNRIGGEKMKHSFIGPILERIARKMGIQINIEPKYGYVGQIVLLDGSKRYFRDSKFDLNFLGASEVVIDKDYAAFFMKSMGYPTVEGEAFFTDDWAKVIGSRRTIPSAYHYACKIGWPVIVKPNSKSQGSGVAKVWNKRELFQAARAFSQDERVFLVQKVVAGNDYRIVVLDNEVISAYQRLPLSVTGDGRSTILGLLRKKQALFKRLGRSSKIPLSDPRITTELTHQEMTLRSRPQKDQRIVLFSAANLSTGGDAIDITRRMHPAWRKLAVGLAKDMNLRYAGIDVMVQGTLIHPPKQFVVIEINAAPGLDNYASLGKKQKQIVESLYRKVLVAMIRKR